VGTVSAAAVTRIHDVEGSLVSVSIGGGAGAAANTDIFIQAAQSLGRRQSNVTLGGFLLDDGAGNDLSVADVHVGLWIWMTHFAVLTALRVRFGTAGGSGNYDEHIVPLTEYPALGGWHRVWVDISRTPDATGGSALDESQVQYFGPVVSLPTVGGNVANLILDAIDHTTTGLSMTGTAGLWSDFVTADQDTQNNKYGVVSAISEIIYCRARLILGTSSSLVFDDSNFVIVFPQQNLVGASFMGITVDLQHASTAVAWASGSLQSPGVVKGDLIVTGTSGAFDVTNCSLTGLRAVIFTSGCTIVGTSFGQCGLVTQSGAAMQVCSFIEPSGAVGVLSDDPSLIEDCSFLSDGTGHAIELTTPGTYTFSGNQFSGYAASGDTGNEAIYNNSGGPVTLNIAGGGSTPSVRNGSGASTVVNNNVSVTFTGMKDNTEVRVYEAGTTTEIAGTENATSGSPDNRSFTFSEQASVSVDYVIHNLGYEQIRVNAFSIPTLDATIPIQQRRDRNYLNP
jgi:hypothetical protein